MDDAAGAIKSIVGHRERLVSLDVFRGITLAGMLIVNNPGYGDITYWPLEHAEWHGWTPTDLVFPFFLFIVGITTHISLEGRRARGDGAAALRHQVWRRAGLIFLIGAVLNWFPFYSITRAPPDADLLSLMGDRLFHLRIPGVLQRIALCYLAGGFIVLSFGWRAQVVLLAAILLGYWAILMLVPVPGTGATGLAAIADPTATLGAWIDRGLLDWGDAGNHLWRVTKVRDPEGVLSTLPAIGTVILGLLAGRWIGQSMPVKHRVLVLLSAGIACVAIGLAWDLVLPINKNLWTSSYVLLSAGLGAMLLAMLMAVTDVLGWRRWAEPFLVFGVNPIFTYALSYVTAVVIYAWWKVPDNGQSVGVERWFTDVAFAPWLPPKMASLGFSVFYVFCFYVLLRAFYKRGVILKV